MFELLTLVDENNNLIGKELRDKCHQQGLWHRRATVFVFNNQDELLIQKRAPEMAQPDLWCGSASGHILASENYEQGAKRELKEELGIECDFKLVGQLTVNINFGPNDIDKEHHKLFVCHYNGKFKIQKQELSQIEFISLDKLQKMIQKKPKQFTQRFLQELEYYLKHTD